MCTTNGRIEEFLQTVFPATESVENESLIRFIALSESQHSEMTTLKTKKNRLEKDFQKNGDEIMRLGKQIIEMENKCQEIGRFSGYDNEDAFRRIIKCCSNLGFSTISPDKITSIIKELEAIIATHITATGKKRADIEYIQKNDPDARAMIPKLIQIFRKVENQNKYVYVVNG